MTMKKKRTRVVENEGCNQKKLIATRTPPLHQNSLQWRVMITIRLRISRLKLKICTPPHPMVGTPLLRKHFTITNPQFQKLRNRCDKKACGWPDALKAAPSRFARKRKRRLKGAVTPCRLQQPPPPKRKPGGACRPKNRTRC